MKTGSTPISGLLLSEIMLIFPKFLADTLLGQRVWNELAQCVEKYY
jgi:hypothetical protein